MANVRVKRTITPRFVMLMLVVAYMFVSGAMLKDNWLLDAQRAELMRLQAQKEALIDMNEQLREAAKFSQTDEFMEREARARGKIRPGEVRYVMSGSQDGGYAKSGN